LREKRAARGQLFSGAGKKYQFCGQYQGRSAGLMRKFPQATLRKRSAEAPQTRKRRGRGRGSREQKNLVVSDNKNLLFLGSEQPRHSEATRTKTEPLTKSPTKKNSPQNKQKKILHAPKKSCPLAAPHSRKIRRLIVKLALLLIAARSGLSPYRL